MFLDKFRCYLLFNNLSLKNDYNIDVFSMIVPKSVQEALSIPSWKIAMEAKMSAALYQNNTWD